LNFSAVGAGINNSHGGHTTNCHGYTNHNESTSGTGQGITLNDIGGGETVIPSITTDTGVSAYNFSKMELVLVSTTTMVAVLPIVMEILTAMKVLVEQDKELLLMLVMKL